MKKTKTSHFDLVIIGAGPAGLSLAAALARGDLNITTPPLKIAIIEKQPLSAIATPDYDGRETALTHFSHHLLTRYGAWDHLPPSQRNIIKDAKVSNGHSDFALHFDHRESGKDHLGFMVSNQAIRQALYDVVAKLPHVTFITAREVTALNATQHAATLTLDNGDAYTASLVVAADSRFSKTRDMMGIPTTQIDFKRTCIVTTMKTEKAHDQTAHEYFHYGQTLAILPLFGKNVSTVITIDSDKADSIMNATPTHFAKMIEGQINKQFGNMALSNKRYAYPLVSTWAEKFYARRFALLGDAAVGMHPVTAHGYNLGLKGADTLATLIKKQMALGLDIGAENMLKTYHQKHQKAAFVIYHGTNALVKLYTSENPLARTARASLLRLGDLLSPARKLIMSQLTEKNSVRA